MTVFLRVLETSVEDKAKRLLLAVNALRRSSHDSAIVERASDDFAAVPGSPLAYWVSDAIRTIFSNLKQFESEDRSVRQGLATADDFRFVRTWWEVSGYRRGIVWFNFAKGGNFSPFYTDFPLILEWQNSGAILKAKVIAEYGNAGKRIYNEEFYFRAGMTWPLRAHRFAPQALPAGCICSVRGYSAFTPEDMLLPTLAIFNSICFDFLFKTFLGRFGYPEFIVGILQKMPWAPPSPGVQQAMSQLARRAWSSKRALDTSNELSHAFLLPPGLIEKQTGLDHEATVRELVTIQSEIDDLAFQLYGIGTKDREAIESATKNSFAEVADDDDNPSEGVNPEDVGEALFGGAVVDTLYSWLVGVSFGRFDPRLATGERAIPPEPAPFDPLPSRSPGMYPEGQEPAERPDILVDDEGHPKDLTANAQGWAERVGVEVPADLRSWLAHEFFPLHIKMYSKSRRKAPIYWQLATPSASYSVWLYIHAFTKDTLFRVQNDYVAGKLAHEERQLETLRAEGGPDPVTAQRKAIEAQEAFVDELRTFLDEVKRVAPLWNPNLDDGVIINFAPLWRLVPQHKPWQKELKSTWDSLCVGKYDWAHLAMHLWPERVVLKCAEDRSLAIAHDLEEVFWYQDDDEKWKPREKPTRPIDALVKERTSSAVKAALKSLMEAPEQSGGARRGRGRR